MIASAMILFGGLAENWMLPKESARAATPVPTPTKTTFTAGNATHTLTYAASATTLKDEVIEGAQKAISVFQPLFDPANTTVPFSLNITLSAKTKGTSLGTTDSLHKGICVITLWAGNRDFDDNEAHWTTAHEIAHCYQEQYMKGYSGSVPANTDWIIEGSADWLMTLVYPDATADYHKQEMADSYTKHQSLFSETYEAAYFWNSLDVNLQTQPTIDFLKAAPTSGFPKYLNSLGNSDDLFQKYALLMAQGSNQSLIPNAPDLTPDADVLTAPSTAEINLPNAYDFTIDNLGIVPADPTKGVEIIMTGFASSGTIIDLLLADGSTMPVIEGAPIQLCDNQISHLQMVSSRANNQQAAGKLEVTGAAIDCPPKETDQSSACLVGTWTAVTGPDSIIKNLNFKPGDIQVTINPDFSGTFRVSNVTSNIPNSKDQATITLMTGHGKFTPVADAKIPGRFTVTDASGDLDEVDVSATVNGTTIKFPSSTMLTLLKQLGASSSGQSPTTDSLMCSGGSTMFYTMSKGTFVWVREDTAPGN